MSNAWAPTPRRHDAAFYFEDPEDNVIEVFWRYWIGIPAAICPVDRSDQDGRGVNEGLAQNLVDAGNRRAKEHGLTNCKFQQGDASNLYDPEDQAHLTMCIASETG